MADVECDIRYQGLTWTTGESGVTLSHGTRPSKFQIETGFNPDFVPRIGPLQLVQNGRVVIEFSDCAIVEVYKSSGDVIRFNYTLEDRRWKWWQGGGVVNGKLNTRRPDGTIKPGTEKSAREMAEFLLEQLGEQDFDASQVPNTTDLDASPEMDWDYRRPAEALDDLLNALGLRCVLTTDDEIVIVQPGNGRGIPTNNLVEDVSEVIHNLAVPDSLLFVAGRTRWQSLLMLEAVGRDLPEATGKAGKIKPIDDLSYKPSDGWEAYSPQHPERGVTFGKDDDERELARRLAKQTVWKWYRIKGQADGNLGPVKECSFRVSTLDQYKLFTELLDTAENNDETFAFQKPYVVGKWYDNEFDGENSPDNTQVEDELSIDTHNSIVQFGEPKYQIDDDGNYEAADLWLFTSYTLADPNTSQPHRYTKEVSLDGEAGTGSLPVPVDDVFRTVRIEHEHNGNRYVFRRSTNNDSTLESAANFYLQAKAIEVEPDPGEDATLGGFYNVSPDGAIEQVTWSLSNGVGTTRVSRNVEHSVFIPRYELRKRAQQLDAVLDKSKKKGA
jgi:hypothetical protein